MGASISSNVAVVNDDFTSSQYQSCGKGTVSNTVDISKVKYTQPANCPAGSTGFSINQAASLDASCVINSLQNATAQVANNLSADAKAGLGLAISSNVSDVQNSITNKVTQKCANVSDTQVANISDSTITACNMAIIQNANLKQSCQLQASQDIATQVSVTAKGEASGLNPTALFGIIGGVILLLIIVGGLGYFFYNKSQNKSATVQTKSSNGKTKTTTTTTAKSDLIGGMQNLFESMTNPDSFKDQLKQNKSWVVLIVFLMILLIIWLFTRGSGNKLDISEMDLQYLNQKMRDAHQIANASQQPSSLPFQQQINIYNDQVPVGTYSSVQAPIPSGYQN